MKLLKTKRLAVLLLEDNHWFKIYETGLNQYNPKGWIYIHIFKLIFILQVKGAV